MAEHTLSESLEHSSSEFVPLGNAYCFEPLALQRTSVGDQTCSDQICSDSEESCSDDDENALVTETCDFTTDTDGMGYPDPSVDLTVPKW